MKHTYQNLTATVSAVNSDSRARQIAQETELGSFRKQHFVFHRDEKENNLIDSKIIKK